MSDRSHVHLVEVSRANNPFPQGGVAVDPGGVRRYSHLPQTLVDVLKSRVIDSANIEAVVEVNGGRAHVPRALGAWTSTSPWPARSSAFS